MLKITEGLIPVTGGTFTSTSHESRAAWDRNHQADVLVESQMVVVSVKSHQQVPASWLPHDPVARRVPQVSYPVD